MLEFDSDEEIFFGPVTSPELRAREKKKIDELEHTVRDFSFHTVANSESENEISYSDVLDAEKVNQEHESDILSQPASLLSDHTNVSISLCGDDISEDKNTPNISSKKKIKYIASTPLVKELSISVDSLECQLNESSDVANISTDSLIFENGNQLINRANGGELFEDTDPVATAPDNALTLDDADIPVADDGDTLDDKQIDTEPCIEVTQHSNGGELFEDADPVATTHDNALTLDDVDVGYTLEDKQTNTEPCIEVAQHSGIKSCKDVITEPTDVNISGKLSSLSMEVSNYELNITAEAHDHKLYSPKYDYQNNNSLTEQIVEVEVKQNISGESGQKIEGVNDGDKEANVSPSKMLMGELSVTADTSNMKLDSFIDTEDGKGQTACVSDDQKLSQLSKICENDAVQEYDYIEEKDTSAGVCSSDGTEIPEKFSEAAVLEVHNDSTKIEEMHLSASEKVTCDGGHIDCGNYVDVNENRKINTSSRKRKRDSMEESDILDEPEISAVASSSFSEKLYVTQKDDIEFSGETDEMIAVQGDDDDGSVLDCEINLTTSEDVSGNVISMQLCEKAVEHPNAASANLSEGYLSMEDSGIHDSSEMQVTVDIEKNDLSEVNSSIINVTEASNNFGSKNNDTEISLNESAQIQVSDESQTSLKIADFDLSSELYIWGETSIPSENASECEELHKTDIKDKAEEEPELFSESNLSSVNVDIDVPFTGEGTVSHEKSDIGSNLVTEIKLLSKIQDSDDNDYSIAAPDCSIGFHEIVLDQKPEPHLNVDVKLRNREISNLSMNDESGIGHDMSEGSLNEETMMIKKESPLNDVGIAMEIDPGFTVVVDVELGLSSVQGTEQEDEVFDSVNVRMLNIQDEINEVKVPALSDGKNQSVINTTAEVYVYTESDTDKTPFIFSDSLKVEEVEQKNEILESSGHISVYENNLSVESVDDDETEISEKDVVYDKKDEVLETAKEEDQVDHDDQELHECRSEESDIIIEDKNICDSGETVDRLDCSNVTSQEVSVIYENEILQNLEDDEEMKISETINGRNEKLTSECEDVMSATQKLNALNKADVTDLIASGNHIFSESNEEVERSADMVLEVSCSTGEHAVIGEGETYKKDIVQPKAVLIETEIDNEVSECLELVNCSITNELSICPENEEMSDNSTEDETKNNKQLDETVEVTKELLIENENDFLCNDSTLNGNTEVVVDSNLDTGIVILDDSVETHTEDVGHIPVFEETVQDQNISIKEYGGCEETTEINVCDVIQNIVETVVDTNFGDVTSNQCVKIQPESTTDEEKSLQNLQLCDDNVAMHCSTFDDSIKESGVNDKIESIKLQDNTVDEMVGNEASDGLKNNECVTNQEMQAGIGLTVAQKQGMDCENELDQQLNLTELLNHPNICADEVSEFSTAEMYEKYHKNLGEVFHAENNVSKGAEDMSFTIILQEPSLNQTEFAPPILNLSTIETKLDENINATTLKEASLLEHSLIHDVAKSNFNKVGPGLLSKTLEMPTPGKDSFLDTTTDYFDKEKECISNESGIANHSVTNNESEKLTESFIETFNKKLKMSDDSLCVDNGEHETKNLLSMSKIFSANFIENFSLKEETLKLSKAFDYDHVSETPTGCANVKKGLEKDSNSTHNLLVSDEWKAQDQSSKAEDLSCISNICVVDEFSFNEENRLRKLREMSADELKDASLFSNCSESTSNEYSVEDEAVNFNREGEHSKDILVLSDKPESNTVHLSATKNLLDASVIEKNVCDEKHSETEPNEEIDTVLIPHETCLSNPDVKNEGHAETENECMQKEKVDFVVCKNEAVKLSDSILDLNESKSVGLLGTSILNYSNIESPSLFSSNSKLHEGSFNVAEMTMMLNSSCNTSRIEDEIIFKNSDLNNVCESPKRVMHNIVSLLPISDVLESEICSARKLSHVTMRPSSAQRCSSRKRTVKKIIGKNETAENWNLLHERDVISSGPMSEEVFQDVKKKLFENDEDLEDIQGETLDLGDLDNILMRMSQSPVKKPSSELNREKLVVESNLEKPVPEPDMEKLISESTGSSLTKPVFESTDSSFEEHEAESNLTESVSESTESNLTESVPESTESNFEKHAAESNFEKSAAEPDMNKLVPESTESNLKKPVSSLIGSNLKTPITKSNLKKHESNGQNLKKPDSKTPKNKTPGTLNKMNPHASLSLRKKPVENAKAIKAPSSFKENIPVKKDVPRLGISKTPKEIKRISSFTPKSVNPPRSLTRQETAGQTPAKFTGLLKKPASVSKPVNKPEQKIPVTKSDSKNTPFAKRNLTTPAKAVARGSMQQNTPVKPPVINKFGYCPAKTSSTTANLSAKSSKNLTPKKYWNVQSPVGKYIQEAPAPPLIQNVKAEEKTFTMPELSSESVDTRSETWKGTKLDKPLLPPVKYSLKTPNKKTVKTTPVKPKSILKVQNIPVPVVTKHIGSSKVVQGCNYLTNEESILNTSRLSQMLKTPKKYSGDMDLTVLHEIDFVHSHTLMKGTKKMLKTPKKYSGDMDLTVLHEIDFVHSHTLMKGTKKE